MTDKNTARQIDLKYLKNGDSMVVEVDKAQVKRKIQEQVQQEQPQLE